jgi:hypothetical protein
VSSGRGGGVEKGNIETPSPFIDNSNDGDGDMDDDSSSSVRTKSGSRRGSDEAGANTFVLVELKVKLGSGE